MSKITVYGRWRRTALVAVASAATLLGLAVPVSVAATPASASAVPRSLLTQHLRWCAIRARASMS